MARSAYDDEGNDSDEGEEFVHFGEVVHYGKVILAIEMDIGYSGPLVSCLQGNVNEAVVLDVKAMKCLRREVYR